MEHFYICFFMFVNPDSVNVTCSNSTVDIILRQVQEFHTLWAWVNWTHF